MYETHVVREFRRRFVAVTLSNRMQTLRQTSTAKPTQRHSSLYRRQHEEGVVIILVAIFLLFVVGAMAALSIDVVTFYNARSEAQLAADSAALAGARVLANSGATSYSDDTM